MEARRYNLIEEIAKEHGLEFGEIVYTFHCGKLVGEEIRIKRRFNVSQRKDKNHVERPKE